MKYTDTTNIAGRRHAGSINCCASEGNYNLPRLAAGKCARKPINPREIITGTLLPAHASPKTLRRWITDLTEGLQSRRELTAALHAIARISAGESMPPRP